MERQHTGIRRSWACSIKGRFHVQVRPHEGVRSYDEVIAHDNPDRYARPPQHRCRRCGILCGCAYRDCWHEAWCKAMVEEGSPEPRRGDAGLLDGRRVEGGCLGEP